MANREIGELDVEIAGAVYKLRPSFTALTEIEDKAGMGLLEISMQFSKGKVSIRSIAALIYGGMMGTSSNLPFTFDQLGDIIVKDGAAEGYKKYSKPAALFLAKALVGSQKKIEEAPKVE